MKTFTYPQKKWVMTAALLAVLGFNVSLNSHQDGIASADFASTSGDLVESRLVTTDGVMPVKYINNGESEVLAVVPKKMTEGKVCDTCGYETIPLTTKNKEDIDALNVQLLRALQKVRPKAEVVAAEEDAAEVTTEKVVVKKSPFDSIRKACKRITDRDEALTCNKERFIALLKDEKQAGKIEPNEALQFYKAEIQSRLVSQISEARRISARARRAQTNMTSWQAFQNSDDAFANTDLIINKALFVIEDLVREVPTKFESVRQHLIVAETDIMKFEAAQIQQTKAQAEANKGTSEGLFLSQDAFARLNELESLRSVMSGKTVNALQEATGNNVITVELNSTYNKFLQDFNTNLINALNGQGTMLNGITVNPAIDLSPRLTNPGRNTGGTIIVNPGVSTRTGANLTAPAAAGTQTILVPVQVQSASPSATTLVMPTQNTGVSFGPMGPASPESLRMRAQIRGQ
ncbi:MAG: hypothetical protein KUL82_10935 [Bdellovibrio sp.]|nr:hypothetical protein [Bdellovibrio sp.]